MYDVTHVLSALEKGDPLAPPQLPPLVYDELRKLAAERLAQEKPGHTLQPTALVHEAYLRLVGEEGQKWNSRGHFFAAAAALAVSVATAERWWVYSRTWLFSALGGDEPAGTTP